MARTYWSEGRNIANLFRVLFILIFVSIYFYVESTNPYVFFGLLLFSIIFAEILGRAWTKHRRNNVAKRKEKVKNERSTTVNYKRKLSDLEILKAKMELLSGTDFERLMEMYYKDKGYQVERVGGSGDHEVDLILKGKEGYKIAVQCKRWKKNVGNDIVLRLKAGKQVHGCLDAWIVTTSYFTKAAQEAAERLNIRLINGVMLQDMINNWKKEKMKKIQ